MKVLGVNFFLKHSVYMSRLQSQHLARSSTYTPNNGDIIDPCLTPKSSLKIVKMSRPIWHKNNSSITSSLTDVITVQELVFSLDTVKNLSNIFVNLNVLYLFSMCDSFWASILKPSVKVEIKKRWNYKIPGPLRRFSGPLLYWRADDDDDDDDDDDALNIE